MNVSAETGKNRHKKRYAKDQCALYKLESKGRLATLLHEDLAFVQDLASSTENYKLFTLPAKADIGGKVRKERRVQEPKRELRRIHKRLLRLLSRVETPAYLHSAVRGLSYISNARAHSHSAALVKVDLRDFYPSIKRHHVHSFFAEQMLCSEDVAAILSRLCTWEGVLPTGSPTSALLAFRARQAMFDELASFAQSRGLVFTVYVDDMVFSGERASAGLIGQIKALVHKHQLSLHAKKTRVYGMVEAKLVTGVIISNGQIRVPYVRLRKIRLLQTLLLRTKGDRTRLPLLEQLVGICGEASQIEPRFKAKVDRYKKSLLDARARR